MRRVRGWGWVAAGILLAGGTVVLGGEGPSFQVDVLDTKIIYTATPADSSVPGFKPHINFPWLTRRGSGIIHGIAADAALIAGHVARRAEDSSSD